MKYCIECGSTKPSITIGWPVCPNDYFHERRPKRGIAGLLYRGRHRAKRYSQPVRELISECRRIPVDAVFEFRDGLWEERGIAGGCALTGFRLSSRAVGYARQWAAIRAGSALDNQPYRFGGVKP